jgi:hypothetical protein
MDAISGVFVVVMTALLIGGFAENLYSATPNPGHPWTEVGDGFWAATGTTAFRTFTFPDATATVLTSFTPVTVAQGGTGTTSTSTALNVLTGLSVKGDLLVHSGVLHGRLPVGPNGQVLTADSASPLGVKWAAATASPAGADGQIQFNDNGSLGATSSVRYDKANNVFALNGYLDLGTLATPSAPATSTIKVYGSKVSGRSMLTSRANVGANYALQPALFQKQVFLVTPGSGTTPNVFGNTLTTVGTVSHVITEQLGHMVNFVSGAVAGNTAGTGGNTTPYVIGTQSGSNGFFMQTRLAFPDATSTGIRAFVGLTSGTMAASVSADNPAGSGVGFQYSTARADTGWKFMTDDGTTQTVTTTLTPFGVSKIMDFYIYVPAFPNNTVLYYRIDNITDGLSVEGTTSTTLPAGATQMRAGFQVNNITAVARNVRMGRLYVETDN